MKAPGPALDPAENTKKPQDPAFGTQSGMHETFRVLDPALPKWRGQ